MLRALAFRYTEQAYRERDRAERDKNIGTQPALPGVRLADHRRRGARVRAGPLA